MTLVEDASPPRTEPTSYRWPVAVFLGVAALLFVVVWLANAYVADAPEAGCCPPSDSPLDYALDGWSRYDSGWYISIAEHGYSLVVRGQSAVAFFPAYPLAVRGLSLVLAPDRAGIVVTFVCGLIAAIVYWRWLQLRVRPKARHLAFLLLFLWPYAWYLYGAVYADALFIVAGLAAFVLIERGHPLLAGIAGAVATAARPVGIAVLVGLVVFVLAERLRSPEGTTGTSQTALERLRRNLRPADAGVLLAAAGIGAWCLFLWLAFDDPLAFSTAQADWGQELGTETLLKKELFRLIATGDEYVIRLLPQAVATLVFLALVPSVVRRFGWAYGAYTLVVVIIPAVGSSTFQGTGRYLLAAFPVFAVVAEWLADRPALAKSAVAVSACGLVFGTALYAIGWYTS